MSLLYVGAGCDISPIKHFDNIKIFYFIDSQPFSEFGIIQSGYITEHGYDGFYRPLFIQELDYTMNSYSMKLISCEGNIRIYSDGIKVVNYFVNTSIPEHYELIKEHIKDFNILFVAGHDPDSIILNNKDNITFIGSEGTSYYPDNGDNIHSLINNINKKYISNKFKQFIFVHKNGNQIKMDSWDSFFEYYISIYV